MGATSGQRLYCITVQVGVHDTPTDCAISVPLTAQRRSQDPKGTVAPSLMTLLGNDGSDKHGQLLDTWRARRSPQTVMLKIDNTEMRSRVQRSARQQASIWTTKLALLLLVDWLMSYGPTS